MPRLLLLSTLPFRSRPGLQAWEEDAALFPTTRLSSTRLRTLGQSSVLPVLQSYSPTLRATLFREASDSFRGIQRVRSFWRGFLQGWAHDWGSGRRKPNPDPIPLLGPFPAPPDRTQALAGLSGLGWPKIRS